MYGKPHLDTNAHTFAVGRIISDSMKIAADENLTAHQRQLARQCRDLAIALGYTFKESKNG